MRFPPLSCFLRCSKWVRLGKGCAGCACTGRMRTLWVWSGAWECPPRVHFLHFISLLVHVSPPRTPLPCRASFAAGGEFGWARVVLVVHRPHKDVVGLEWCMGMAPHVHFLDFISLLVHVSPPCASLPCHASRPPAGEVGWARVVLTPRAPAA